jgi:hypothetical protein
MHGQRTGGGNLKTGQSDGRRDCKLSGRFHELSMRVS